MKYSEIDEEVKKSLKRDWIITNGIGGFCSQSALGCNTRKYHGLLIAPLTPPARRFLILSKLDESIETNGTKYNLFTNMANGEISEGYKYLVDFKKEYIPIFTYKVENIIIKKFICMDYGKNTVVVYYQIKNQNAEAKLTLAPVVNFRDFHSINKDHQFNVEQSHSGNKVRVVLEKNSETPIYMNCSDGRYFKHIDDTFRNMYYLREEERGFEAEENHYVPGVYSINLEPNEEKEITFVCSLEENIEEIDGIKVINKELLRMTGIIYDTGIIQNSKMNDKKLDMLKALILATDNFIVNRPSFGLHTVIAGYPWFLDWGRDSLISFEGLLLLTKRYELAKEVLLTNIRDIKYGLVPNGYSGYDNRPLYNSADSSLLLIEQVYKYLKYTNDNEFIKDEIYPSLVKIMDAYSDRIDVDGDNIYLDKEDNLLSAGTENTQITWMDVKIDNHAITPRNGKTVELNALWYNALKIMARFAEKYENKQLCRKYLEMAEKTKKSFDEKFYNEEKHCLYDVLGDSKVRPNQLFALSLSHPIVDNAEIAEQVLNTVENKLLNKYGLKTLSSDEDGYVDVYEGSAYKRDLSYHQGITWPWLLGLYYDALKNTIIIEKNRTKRQELEEKITKLVYTTKEIFKSEMFERSSIGTISEIYDSTEPYEERGAFAQAWSVAEIFRIVLNKR
ncbi:MAG: amylo-alpha-1,6-glucosidase [Clostridia bacterium]